MPRRIINKPHKQLQNLPELHNYWDQILNYIFNGEYVLVVGSNIILKQDLDPHANGDSQQYILQTVIDELKNDNILSQNYTCDSFTQLNEDINDLHKKTAAYLRNCIEYTTDDISDDLLKILKTRLFRVVITTTIDPYLEQAMREVWGDELRVLNIFEAEDHVKAYKNDYFDIPPTLYYAFGKVGETQYVLTDNDAIEAIDRWITDKSHPAFRNYIKDKRMLAIGCKFEDWFFRFFWYVLQGDISNLKTGNGEVAITLDIAHSEIDQNLNTFLKRNNVAVFPNAQEFLAKLAKDCEQPLNEQQIFTQRRQQGGIFISYAAEDKATAIRLFNQLTNRGLNVWIDEKQLVNQKDNNYDLCIQRAIEQCRIFMPIFSKQLIIDYETGKKRYYKENEWRWANVAEKTIKPVVIHGYNCRDEKHQEICSGYPHIAHASAVLLHEAPIEELVQICENILKAH
ncbi:MAG: toll/interleukin-1 receptor domain-containing protein [Alistipes sp.]|nr:toll/interleukin-1 receptor domain-containing protein [Rikenellaceae bacterium]MBQ6881458.1 toll/interleukin-1 receptor domain-containing protein [Alistipes sp.]